MQKIYLKKNKQTFAGTLLIQGYYHSKELFACSQAIRFISPSHKKKTRTSLAKRSGLFKNISIFSQEDEDVFQ